jgi:hypothetical protein
MTLSMCADGLGEWGRGGCQPRLRSLLGVRAGQLAYVGRDAAVCATGIGMEHKRELEAFMAAAF